MSRSTTDLEIFDRVTLSGYCLSEGCFAYRIQGTIGTVEPDQIKLWPHDGRWNGKLWFHLRTLRIHKHERDTFVVFRNCGGWDYYER
jgi:hypothetical protein